MSGDSASDYGITGLIGDTSTDPGTLGPQVSAATSLGQGWSYDTYKTPDTATTNALQMMAPTTTPNTASSGTWAGFWSQLGGSVVTAAAKTVATAAGAAPAVATPVPVPPPNPNSKLLLVAAVGVVVFLLATHKAA